MIPKVYGDRYIDLSLDTINFRSTSIRDLERCIITVCEKEQMEMRLQELSEKSSRVTQQLQLNHVSSHKFSLLFQRVEAYNPRTLIARVL